MLGPNLVGTDVLGNSTCFTSDHVGLTNRVQELRLTVINVTHDGHDRRANLQILVVVFDFVVDIEALEEFLILILWRDNLDFVAKFLTQHLEGRGIQRLCGGCHLTQLEQHRHEVARGDTEAGNRLELLRKIADRGTLAQAHRSIAVTARNTHTAKSGSLLHFKFLPLRAL